MSEPESAEHRFIRVLDEYGRALRDAVGRVCRGPLGLHRDEIEQEARIRLWRALRRETAIVDLRRYLRRIVATAAIDAMRQIRSRREIPLERHETERRTAANTMELAATDPSPEQVASARELGAVARRILNELPANRRRAVALYLRGLSAEEVAAVMGWSEPKARNLLYRGLADLRARFVAATSDRPQPTLGAARPDEARR